MLAGLHGLLGRRERNHCMACFAYPADKGLCQQRAVSLFSSPACDTKDIFLAATGVTPMRFHRYTSCG